MTALIKPAPDAPPVAHLFDSLDADHRSALYAALIVQGATMPIYRDHFTGKVVDRLSDLLPSPNGGHCDHCGGPTIDRCMMCGAPQCCPACCIESQEEEVPR